MVIRSFPTLNLQHANRTYDRKMKHLKCSSFLNNDIISLYTYKPVNKKQDNINQGQYNLENNITAVLK